ncbi:bifunctional purple acid phosphatase 26-like isoform X2 [Chenopodium quinoa]|uniref:bifunctional purple acid phosphatase 26-like isoform X2 n=1 Tax=Chenopodium quinoa TaxID=63459 RepID=UPI000B7775A4|nr:bifunctional purple acid phosphatase 26-like isoform X2 [Chenopodium quinoa]
MMEAKLLVLLITIIVSINSLSNGVNGESITSSYVRLDPPSTDIPLEDTIFAAPAAYNAPQQVHITQGDYDGKAVIISWVTPHLHGSHTVYYGTKQGKYTFKAKAFNTSYSFKGYKSGQIYHCVVDGLEYNTKYYYRIGSGPSHREFWFKTPPEVGPDSPYTFGLIGDLGQTKNSLSTLQHYMKGGEGEAVLFVGDLTYADRHIDVPHEVGLRWDTWGRLVEPSTAYQPWIWTTGNHDIDYFPQLGLIGNFLQFKTRYLSPFMHSGSTDPLWYAIRRGPAHIIVLSSYSSFVKYSPQYKWLEAELKKVDRKKTPWLIVIMHVPLYNSNTAHYMEGESMRPVVEQWFVDYKVDVVFAGHVHAYERSHRVSNLKYNISNGECTPVLDESAPFYVTIGDGGNSEGIAGEYISPQPHYSAFREPSFGHAILDIKNKTHAFYYWHRNQDGNKVTADSFVLHNQYWTS